MSHSGGNRAGCANYQACHLKLARLLDNSSKKIFSPRCLEMDNSVCSARTSLSVGEELPYSHRADINPILSRCGTRAGGATNFTKYLKKVDKIQEEHEKILSENMQLNNQLSKEIARNRQLEEKAATLEEALLKEKHIGELPILPNQQPSKNTVLHQRVSTTAMCVSSLKDSSTSSDYPSSRQECAVQTLKDTTTLPVDLVSISKSELADLENDMKTLREAVRSKEEMWNQAMERERNYREHWARLSRELITIRQQLDFRDTEFKNLERKLTDQTEELKATQKELSFTKKQLQKNQRNSGCSNQTLTTADRPESREIPHLKFTEVKHVSPRQSTRFRSNKTSPTKDGRNAFVS